MIKDTIYREDAIKAVSLSCGVCLAKNTEDCEKCSVPQLQELIKAISSADRPQGKWIAVSAFEAFGGDEATWMAHGNPTAFHYCSECKEQTRIDEFGEEILSNFCPDCGARMRPRLQGKHIDSIVIDEIPWKGTGNDKECHKPESEYYRAYCEERKEETYCEGCKFWY